MSWKETSELAAEKPSASVVRIREGMIVYWRRCTGLKRERALEAVGLAADAQPAVLLRP